MLDDATDHNGAAPAAAPTSTGTGSGASAAAPAVTPEAASEGDGLMASDGPRARRWVGRSPLMLLRRACRWLIDQRAFDATMLAIILASTGSRAESPRTRTPTLTLG
jgi:hypothetical protein